MANINLSSGEMEKAPAIELGNGGQVAIFSALIVVLLLYGGELLYGRKLTSDIDKVKTEYESGSKIISGPEAATVSDFDKRLTLAKKEVDQGRNIRENLEKIEKAIIPGVYLSSFKFDDKANTITLDCVGDGYNLAAKQILSFKKSTDFAEASGGETSLDDKLGKVNFKVNLILK
jgi:hypothetical protein